MISETRPLVFLWEELTCTYRGRWAAGEKGNDGQFSEALYIFCYKNKLQLDCLEAVRPGPSLADDAELLFTLKVSQEAASALEGLGQHLYVLLLAGAGEEHLLDHPSSPDLLSPLGFRGGTR